MSNSTPAENQYRSKVTNTHATLIRADIPFGPVHLPQIESIAKKHRVHPDYMLKIATGLTHRNTTAFPPGHPIIPNLPRRRRSKPGASHRVSRSSKEILLLQQEYRCTYCFSQISVDTSTIDHIVPRSNGGSHHISNLQLTCWECNHDKGPTSDQDWRQQLNKQQKLQHLMTSPKYKKAQRHPFKGMNMRCTCHIHGCRPDCKGCQLCQHRSKEQITRPACPAGPAPPSRCNSPTTCTQTKSCRLEQESKSEPDKKPPITRPYTTTGQ